MKNKMKNKMFLFWATNISYHLLRGGQLKANNAAMLKTKFQVTQNRLVVSVFLFCRLRVYTPVKLLQANLRLHFRQEQKRLQGQSTADTAQYFHQTMALW
jgi:hypothetical protein